MLHRRYAIPLAALLALASVPALAACSTGAPAESKAKQSDSSKAANNGTTIPTDFPKSVPLYDGTVVSSLALGSGSKKIWDVGFQVPSASAMTAIQSQLAGAGFKGELQGTAGKVGESLVSMNTKYTVSVVLSKNSKGLVASYQVVPNSLDN